MMGINIGVWCACFDGYVSHREIAWAPETTWLSFTRHVHYPSVGSTAPTSPQCSSIIHNALSLFPSCWVLIQSILSYFHSIHIHCHYVTMAQVKSTVCTDPCDEVRKTAVPRVGTVVGGIGSGKETLLKALHILFPHSVEIILEPIEKWKSSLYALQEAKGSAVPGLLHEFQLLVLEHFEEVRTRITAHRASTSQKICLVERCASSTGQVFIQSAMNSGIFSAAHGKELQNRAKELKVDWDVILHVNTTVSECLKRISSRDRPYETGLEQPYLDDLERATEQWLSTASSVTPVVEIDGERSRYQVMMAAVAALGLRLD